MDLKNNQITVREILANPKAKEIVIKEYPELLKNPMIGMFQNMTLESLIKYAKGIIPQNKIDQIMNQLKSI